jgi:WD40 repeat protein
MHRLLSPLFAACLCLLFGLAWSPAAKVEPEKKETPKPRIDADGDPLPEGALARLGTKRFRADGFLSGVEVSPDGKTIALASNNKAIVLLDLTTGQKLHEIKPQGILSGNDILGFSPDGELLAIQYRQNKLGLYDVKKGEIVKDLEGGRGVGTRRLCFSADSKVVAGGGESIRPSLLGVWDVESAKFLGSFNPIQEVQARVAIASDGKSIASWGKEPNRDPSKMDEPGPSETVQLWDVATRKETQQFQIDAPDNVSLVAFSPNGKCIAVHGDRSTIYLFDTGTGKLKHRVACRRGVLSLVFSPDGKSLGAIDNEGVCQIWDPATGKRIDVFAGPAETGYGASLVFTRDNRLLAWAARGQAVCVWDVRTRKVLTAEGGHTSNVRHLSFSGDDKLLLSVSGDGVVCTWAAGAAKEMRRWRIKEDYPGSGALMAATVLAPDGKYLAAASVGSPGTRLYDVPTGIEVCQLTTVSSYPLAMAFSRDGTRLVAKIHDQKGQVLRIWDVASGGELLSIKTDAGEVAGMTFSPNGKTLVSAGTAAPPGEKGVLRFYDAVSGEEGRTVERPNEMLSSPIFSGDGSRIAVAGRDPASGQRGILIFDAASGNEIRKLAPPEGYSIILGPVISHDGRTVAAAYGKNKCKLRLWELTTGSLRREFTIPSSGVGAIAFSSDGRKIAVACADTSTLIFDATGGLAAATESLSADAADALWTDLKAGDAQKADAAIWRLSASPKEAIPVLKKHLKAVDKTTVTEKQISQWIVQLDDDDFDKREKATRELEGAGSQAKAALQNALDGGKLSNEAKARVEKLLQHLAKPRDDSVEMIQPLRALEVLEHLATPEAKDLLATLAKGHPDALLTREAKAALERLGAKP